MLRKNYRRDLKTGSIATDLKEKIEISDHRSMIKSCLLWLNVAADFLRFAILHCVRETRWRPKISCAYRKPNPGRLANKSMVMERPMVAFLIQMLLLALRSRFSRRAGLEAENLILRQQLIVLRRKSPRCVRLWNLDRLLLVWRYRPHPALLDAIIIALIGDN